MVSGGPPTRQAYAGSLVAKLVRGPPIGGAGCAAAAVAGVRFTVFPLTVPVMKGGAVVVVVGAGGVVVEVVVAAPPGVVVVAPGAVVVVLADVDCGPGSPAPPAGAM